MYKLLYYLYKKDMYKSNWILKIENTIKDLGLNMAVSSLEVDCWRWGIWVESVPRIPSPLRIGPNIVAAILER